MDWKRFFSRLAGAAPLPRTGFVYVADDETGAMAAAAEGALIGIAGRGPPWIVVQHDLSTITLPRWPGKLWQVDIAEAASERDQRAAGGLPHDDAGYTRAIRVRVLEEYPLSPLFGAQGEAILEILQKASRLDADTAIRLGATRDGEAGAAWERIWRLWLHRREIFAPVDRFDGVLRLGTVANGSPVGAALTLIHGTVSRRAREVAGEAAFTIRDEDVMLNEPWDSASTALLEAAFAFGVEDISPGDRERLARAWRVVFGPDPVPSGA